MLSRRVLFYTDQMLLWEYGHCRLSEDRYPQMQGDDPYALDLLGSGACQGADEALTADTWYCGLVKDYTRRQLTFGRDKMIAIGALAKATSVGRRIPYFAGIWGDSFRYGLMWRRKGPGSKSATTTCPSWSWASQSSPVSYGFLRSRWLGSWAATSQVLDVHVEAADMRKPFGDVQSGYVTLQTKVQTARIMLDCIGRGPASDKFNREGVRALFNSYETLLSLWPGTAYMDDEDVRQDEVLVAVVGETGGSPVALLLHPPRFDTEEYRRVGIALLDCGHHFVESNILSGDLDSNIIQWTTRTIKIV